MISASVPLPKTLTSKTPTVEFLGATKFYGKISAVSNLSFSLYPGELFGFLGPNGAGKTTAMKMTVGLVRPTFGKIKVCGYDVQVDSIASKRLVGFVPDSPYIYDSLTGREFLHYCAGLYKIGPVETVARVEELMALFHIGAWADKRAGEYSHGMKQRVVMASAFLHHPKVILIDEPMVGLDPAGVRLIKEILRKFASRGGTVFLSTHTLSVAEELCDRIGIIKSGRMLTIGSLAEVMKGGDRLEDFFLALTGDGGIR